MSTKTQKKIQVALTTQTYKKWGWV